MFSNSGGALPTGLNAYTVYYVINKAANTFQVSLTLGGVAVTFSDDGSGTNQYHVLSQARLTSTYISVAAVNSDAMPLYLMCPRVTCNQHVWVRAKASGGTNSITGVFNLHTYSA